MSDIQPGDTAQWRGDGKHVRGCVQVRVVAVGELGFCLVAGENGLTYWVYESRLTRVDAAPPAASDSITDMSGEIAQHLSLWPHVAEMLSVTLRPPALPNSWTTTFSPWDRPAA